MRLFLILLGLLAALPARAQELRLFNWSNYIPPALLERFTKETGIKVVLDTYDSNDSMLSKLQAGGGAYDVVVPTGPTLAIMIKDGLLQPVDAPSLANFKNIRETFREQPYDPGRRYSVPYMYGVTGIAYDADKVDGAALPPSWATLFDPPPTLRGKVANLNEVGENWVAAAYYLKIDPCTEKGPDAQAIYDLLAKQKEYVLVYSSSATIDRMASGEASMHMMWNGAFHRAQARKASLRYVIPQEGANIWTDHLAIPKGAPNPALAKRFMDFMLTPESAAEASNFTGYNNGIAGSDAFLRADLKADPAVNLPDAVQPILRPSPICSAASRDLRDRVWTRLRR